MSVVLRLLRLYRPYFGWVLLGVLLSCVTLVSNIALMAVSGWFIAAMAIAGAGGVSMNYFSPAAIIRAVAIFRTAGRYAERLVTHEATFRLISALRVWFYRNLEPLAPAALQDLRSGDLLSRIRADIDSLDNFYVRILVPLCVALVGVALSVWVMSLYHASLAWVLLLLLVTAGVLLPLLIARLGDGPGRQVVEHSAQLRTQVIDSVQGLAELTLYAALGESARKVNRHSQAWLQAQQRMGRVSGLAQSGLLLSANLALWTVMLLAVPLLAESVIQPAELAMLALFTLAAFESVMPLPEAFRLFGQVMASARRVFALVDRAPAVQDPLTPAAKPQRFCIELQQVGFAYDEDSPPVLQDLSLRIAPGEKIAVVGPTGSGKSSLLQVLLGFRPFQSGQVSVGGVALREFRGEQLREWIAVVPQQVYLFNSTIRQNLLLARPDATQQDLDRVCQLAQLDEFIAAQPEGYDTWVGETGVKVSGGQARRIAIARALLRDFECLVLDEPGEGLDPATERELLDGLVSGLNGKSLILITHRQAALDRMDQILLLDNTKGQSFDSYPAYLAR